VSVCTEFLSLQCSKCLCGEPAHLTEASKQELFFSQIT
jgi:hypothetical protein